MKFARAGLGLAVLLLVADVNLARAAEQPSFRREIAPLLAAQCVTCHGPEKQKGGYRVDSFVRLMQKGDSGEPPVVPGVPASSELFRRVTASDADDRMPQKADPLSTEAIERLRRWILSGAPFDGNNPEQPLAEMVEAGPHPTPPAAYAFPVPIQAVAFAAEDRLLAGGFYELNLWTLTGRLIRRIPNLP